MVGGVDPLRGPASGAGEHLAGVAVVVKTVLPRPPSNTASFSSQSGVNL